MDLFEAIIKTKRTWEFEETTVTNEQLQQLLACAQLAPSVMGVQNFFYIAVTDENKKKEIIKTVPNGHWMEKAALIIVVCAQVSEDDDTAVVDSIIATQQLVLGATAIGLGSNWILTFDPTKVAELLRIPDSFAPIALIPIGKPTTNQTRGMTRKLKELAFKDEYGQPCQLSD